MRDLGWLDTLTVGGVLAALIAIGALIKGLSWIVAAVRPMLAFWHQFMEDWQGVPDRPGVPARDGVMAQIGTLRCDVEGLKADTAAAAFNTQPNHGTSSHDALMHELTQIHAAIAESRRDRQDLHAEVSAISATLIDAADDLGTAV